MALFTHDPYPTNLDQGHFSKYCLSEDSVTNWKLNRRRMTCRTDSRFPSESLDFCIRHPGFSGEGGGCSRSLQIPPTAQKFTSFTSYNTNSSVAERMSRNLSTLLSFRGFPWHFRFTTSPHRLSFQVSSTCSLGEVFDRPLLPDPVRWAWGLLIFGQHLSGAGGEEWSCWAGGARFRGALQERRVPSNDGDTAYSQLLPKSPTPKQSPQPPSPSPWASVDGRLGWGR